MNLVTSFLSTISVASVVLTALWFLVPKGATENNFKYAMSVFMIFIIVSTISSAVKKPENKLPEINTAQAVAKADLLSAETVEYIIESLLDKCNIKYKEVVIIMDNSDSADINITKARIEFANEKDFPMAAEIIKKQTGIVLVR